MVPAVLISDVEWAACDVYQTNQPQISHSDEQRCGAVARSDLRLENRSSLFEITLFMETLIVHVRQNQAERPQATFC